MDDIHIFKELDKLIKNANDNQDYSKKSEFLMEKGDLYLEHDEKIKAEEAYKQGCGAAAKGENYENVCHGFRKLGELAAEKGKLYRPRGHF